MRGGTNPPIRLKEGGEEEVDVASRKAKYRKRWWSKQLGRLIGPVIWLLARLIDKTIEHLAHR
jgi:hypothetical protein